AYLVLHKLIKVHKKYVEVIYIEKSIDTPYHGILFLNEYNAHKILLINVLIKTVLIDGVPV
ncbi:hypothetical protein LV812_20860, partial [[Clostridium] innocuum]|uniref:hypothetical protein n=1 Tax=Clostridium innocuum TaxID=1522 RepID=UPI001F5AA414